MPRSSPPADPRLALARWYHDQMLAWNQLHLQSSEGLYAALRSFDGVSDHLRGLLPWLAARAETDDAAAEVYMRMLLAGGFMSVLRFDRAERIRWGEAALACARRLGDSSIERAHLQILGSLYAGSGDPARAIGCFRAALDPPGDRPAAARARLLSNMALAYVDQGDIADGRRILEEALAISLSEKEMDDAAITLVNLGGLHVYVGRPRDAIACLEEGMRISGGMKDDTLRAEALNTLGNAWVMLGEPDRAAGFLQEAVGVYRRLGFEHGIVVSLLNLGIAHLERGDGPSAVETLEEALRLTDVPPSPRTDRLLVRCKVLNRLGKARGMQGEMSEADLLFREALGIAEAVQDLDEVMTSCVGRGFMRLEAGDLDGAEDWFDRAITLARRTGDRPGLASGLFFHARVLRARGRHAAAMEKARAALAIYEAAESPKAAALRTILDEWAGLPQWARRWKGAWRRLRNLFA